jgi:hypothetical protein
MILFLVDKDPIATDNEDNEVDAEVLKVVTTVVNVEIDALKDNTCADIIDISDDNAVDKEDTLVDAEVLIEVTVELVVNKAVEVEVLKEVTADVLNDISVEREEAKEEILVDVKVLKVDKEVDIEERPATFVLLKEFTAFVNVVTF